MTLPPPPLPISKNPSTLPRSPLVLRQLLEVKVAEGGGCIGPGTTVAAAVCVAATQRVGANQRNHLPAGNCVNSPGVVCV
jgi:hypothetical protein